MSDIYVNNNFYQGTTQACIVDLTPPTFAGISSLIVASRGQFRASWLAASDVTTPLRYEVYAQASTATGLFATGNLVGITDALQLDFWTLRDGSFLVNGTTYYVGVRARDGVSNIDSNVVSLNAISTGIFVSSNTYLAQGAFVVGANNQFQGTMWILRNSVLGTTDLGTASYTVYDKAGNAVSGMTESGISADSNGQFKITPITSVLSQTLDHYMIKVSITMDSAVRTGYIPLLEPPPLYELEGVSGLNQSHQLEASFWVTGNEQILTGGRLGTAAYVIYDKNGTLVSGMAQSGITADANGLFKITPVASTLTSDLTFYSMKVSITVDGVVRSEFINITGKIPEYESRAQFSINALNQFQATIWATRDGVIAAGAGVGVANYVVYDASGSPVSGLSQSGISADGNGRFQITPVSAVLLTDLTHYSVKLGIIIDGIERISYRGFTLLGN